jgi:hypothetical protein
MNVLEPPGKVRYAIDKRVTCHMPIPCIPEPPGSADSTQQLFLGLSKKRYHLFSSLKDFNHFFKVDCLQDLELLS